MKSRTLLSLIFILLSTILTVSANLAAQDVTAQARPAQHHHYKLIDMGTFGGSISAVNMAVDVNGRAVGPSRTTVGWSATSVPKLPTSHPRICGGDDGLGSDITHAFQWHGGFVTDLGALPPTESNCSNAYQVNAFGEIAGFSENGEFDPQIGFNQSRAVRWRDGQIEDLGSLGGNQNQALALNNRGQIVGFSLNTIPDPYSLYDSSFGSTHGTQTRAVLWQHGRMQDLGTLGGNDAGAFYVNDRGQIAGFSYTSTIPNPATGVPPLDPFLWDNGRMADLGNLGGGFGLFTGQGGGLNNRGEVIGVSSVAANPGACFTEFDPNCHPFLWDRGTLIDLNTTTAGGNPLSADGINDAGQIVGGADFSVFGSSSFDAYIWTRGVAVDLGDAPGDCFSRGLAINSQGQVVGNSFSCDGNFDRAFLWENGSIVDLNTAIPPEPPLKLVGASDINDRGEIAGEGIPNECSDIALCGHAFLLIPCDENHPNIEGCDYSMVDAAAATAVNRVPATKIANPFSQANPTFGGLTNPMIYRFGRPFGQWNRGLGVEGPAMKPTSALPAGTTTQTSSEGAPEQLPSCSQRSDGQSGAETEVTYSSIVHGYCHANESVLDGWCSGHPLLTPLCISRVDVQQCPKGAKVKQRVFLTCPPPGPVPVDKARPCSFRLP